jgi:hypothetical protein
VNKNVAKLFIEQAVDKSVVAAKVMNIMLENMLKYPGLFAMINRAMMTDKREKIEEALVAITSKPMEHSDVDRCVDILSDAGCL